MVLKQVAISALFNRPWLYRHIHDRNGPSRIVEFDASGKINGYNGEQEISWILEDDVLWFINAYGQKSIKFDTAYRSLGKLVLEGNFVLPGTEGVLVRLDEGAFVERLGQVDIKDVSSELPCSIDDEVVPFVQGHYGDRVFSENSFLAPGFRRLLLTDVRVISRFGALRKGNDFVSESAFQHPFYLTNNVADDRHGGFLHNSQGPTSYVERAIYACGGMYSNYYHWLMFQMVKLQKQLFDGFNCVLISEPLTEFQKTGLREMLREFSLNAVFLKDNVDIAVGNLLFPLQHGTTGVDPNPCVANTFSVLKGRLLKESAQAKSRIYISRSDTTERKLINEAEIEQLLERKYGFRIVSLTGLSLEDQIQIFHDASYVVAPHGAGLTNIGFCNRGAKVLEFQSSAYINWCMKKIAAVSRLEYGCIMGASVDDGSNYTIDMTKLTAALDSMLQ